MEYTFGVSGKNPWSSPGPLGDSTFIWLVPRFCLPVAGALSGALVWTKNASLVLKASAVFVHRISLACLLGDGSRAAFGAPLLYSYLSYLGSARRPASRMFVGIVFGSILLGGFSVQALYRAQGILRALKADPIDDRVPLVYSQDDHYYRLLGVAETSEHSTYRW